MAILFKKKTLLTSVVIDPESISVDSILQVPVVNDPESRYEDTTVVPCSLRKDASDANDVLAYVELRNIQIYLDFLVT